jgi:TolB protein
MRRLLALLVLAALLAPAAADAAFPGRNGAIVYGAWFEYLVGNSEGGSTFYDGWLVGVFVRPGWEHSLAACVERPESLCRPLHYANPAIAPDGRSVAMDAGEALALVDIRGGDLQMLPRQTDDNDQPAFSPSGGRLAFAGRGADGADLGVWVRSLRRGVARQVAAPGRTPAWSVRGWIAFVRDDGIWRVRPDGSRLRRIARRADAPAWSPDGRRLVFLRREVRRHRAVIRKGGVFVADADGSDVRRLGGKAAAGPVTDVAWSPDGRRLVIAGDDALTMTDLQGRQVRAHHPFYGDGSLTTISVDWQPIS